MDTKVETNKKISVAGKLIQVIMEETVGKNTIGVRALDLNWQQIFESTLSEEQVKELISLLSEAYTILQKETAKG